MRQLGTRALQDRMLGIHRAKYSPSGDWIVGSGGHLREPGRITIWDALSLEMLAVCQAPKSKVTAVAISHGRRLMVSCCESADSIELWDTGSWQCTGALPVFSPPFRRSPVGFLIADTMITELVFSDDDEFLVAGCWDATAKVWEMSTRTKVELSTPNRSNADFVAFVGADDFLAVGNYQTLSVWNYVTGTLEKKFTLDRDEAWWHLAIRGGKQILSISHEGTIRPWNSMDWSYEESRIRSKRGMCARAYSEFSDLLAVGFESGDVYFWNVGERRDAGRWKIRTGSICSMSFAPAKPSICIVTASPHDCVVEYEYEP